MKRETSDQLGVLTKNQLTTLYCTPMISGDDIAEFDTKANAHSTNASQASALKLWRLFRRVHQEQVWANQVMDIKRFIVFMSKRGLKGSSCESYLASVKHIHSLHCKPFPSNHPSVAISLRAAKRIRPSSKMQPLTAGRLRDYQSRFAQTHSPKENLSWLIARLQWNILARVSEVLVGKAGEPASIVPEGVTFMYRSRNTWEQSPAVGSAQARLPDRIVFTMNKTKCDQEGHGVSVALDRTDGPLCPVADLCAYMQGRTYSPTAKALFPTSARKNLSGFVKLIAKRLGLAGTFNTHSLRSGAATSLMLAGADALMIKSLGRWASDVYQGYVRTNPSLALPASTWINDPSSISSKLQAAPAALPASRVQIGEKNSAFPPWFLAYLASPYGGKRLRERDAITTEMKDLMERWEKRAK